MEVSDVTDPSPRRRRADARQTGSAQRPSNVHIASGSEEFYAQLRQSLGFDQRGDTAGGKPGSAVDPKDVLPNMRTILSGQQAIMQATKDIVSNMKVVTDMMTQFQTVQTKTLGEWAKNMNEYRKQERKHMSEMLNLMLKGVTTLQSSVGVGGGGVPGGMSGVPGMPGGMPLPYFAPSRAPRTPVSGGGYEDLIGGRTTLGNLQSRLGQYVHNNYGMGNNTPDLYGVRDRDGNLTHYKYTLDGQDYKVGLDHPDLSMFQRQARNRGIFTAVSNGYTHGGIGGALRAAPYVGTAIMGAEAVNDTAKWFTNQRAANAPYQNIYGGQNFSLGGAVGTLFGDNTDRSGFSNRMQEFGFTLGQRFGGGMTGQMSQEAFRGVSSLGYMGNQRGGALDFVSQEYKQLGMSVGQSLQLLQVSAQHANSSLAGVSQGLQTVTQAAAATGQSAAALQQIYGNNYSAALGAGFGSGSGNLATALTMSGAGVSRDLAGLNYTAAFSNPGMMNMLAAQGGMTPGQMIGQLNNGNTRAYTKPLQQVINRNMLGTMTQGVRDQFQSLVGQAGGNTAVAQSPGAQRSIAVALMQNQNWNIYAARQALANSGVDTSQLDDSQVTEAFVANLAGAGPDAQAQKTNSDSTIHPATSADKSNAGKNSFLGQYESKLSQVGDIGGNTSTWDHFTSLWGGDSQERSYMSARNSLGAYKDMMGATGKIDPAIEAAISKLGNSGDARVQVQTKSGARVVTLAEAIAHYSDQLSSGNAVVMNAGDQSGLRISQVTGVTDQGFIPGQNGSKDTTTSTDTSIGQSLSDYQKANPSTGSANGSSAPTGTVNISPSPELMRLFNFTSSGNVNIQGAAAAGVPPQPSVGAK
jgi:hypothetical protein